MRDDRTFAAIATLLAAMFAMSLQAISMKYVSSELSIWQITIFRSLVILSALLPLLLLSRRKQPDKVRARGWISVRSVLMVIMNLFYYGSLPLMDVAVAATANYTAPVFIFIMGGLLLGERINPIGLLAIAMAFLSGVLMLRPGTEDFNGAVIFPVIAALAYGCASIVTRFHCQGVSVLRMVFGVHAAFLAAGVVGQLVIPLIPVSNELQASNPFIFSGWTPMTWEIWGIIFWLAVLNTATHTGFARAYQMAPSSLLAPWEYTYLPFVVILGFVFFLETPDLLAIIAMVCIFTSGLGVLWSKRIYAIATAVLRKKDPK